MMKNVRWEKALLSPTSCIRDAINSLSESSLGIVIVLDSEFNIVGTITDGDVRRGFIRGLNLESAISGVMNREPITVSKNMSKEDVLKIMSKNRIQQIPILDEKLKFAGIHLWSDSHESVVRKNIFVIMAGGRGTRLLPRTERTPKPMLLVGGKPILEHIIDRAKAEGFGKFVLAIHHLGDLIERHFGDGSKFGVEISYIREKVPLGTAGALKLIQPKPKEPIIVSNGDVITDIKYGDILDFHNDNEAVATMAVRMHETQYPFGVVQTNGIDIVSYEEKPVSRLLINAGIYVVNPATFDFFIEATEFHMPALFELVQLHQMKSIVFPLHEKWLDLGSPSDLEKAEFVFDLSPRKRKQ